MRITTQHSSSSHGIPVVLDGRGRVVDYGPGIKAVLDHLGRDKHWLAEAANVSVRTVEGWFIGRMPETRALNVLRDALEAAPK